MSTDDRTQAALDELDRAVVEPFRRAWSDVVPGVWAEAAEALAPVVDAHRAALQANDLGGDTAAPERWESLVAYRREVAGRVHGPFLEALRSTDSMRRIREAGEGAQEQAWKASETLDARRTLPWDDAGLARRDTDGLPRRVGTSLVRGMRRVRKSAPRPDVPVRALAQRVLRREATPRQSKAFEEAQRSWARWVATLEHAWDEWAGDVLRPLAPAPEAGAERDEEDVRSAEAERRAAATAAARALQEALEAALATPPHEEAVAQGAAATAHCASVLARELPLAGTAALSLASDDAGPPEPRIGSALTWEEWYGHAVNRFALHGALLDVVVGCESAVTRFEEQVEEHIGGQLLPRCDQSAQGLRRLAARLAEGSPAGMLEAMARVRPEAQRHVDEGVGAVPDPAGFRAVVESCADALSEAIHQLAQVVPSELTLHDLPAAGASFSKPGDPRTVKLREMARQTFDVLRMEKIRTSPLPLAQRIKDIVATAGGVHDVVSFGLDAAESELAAGEEDAGDHALTLAREGLERAADVLAGLPEQVDGAVVETRLVVEGTVARGWTRFADRGLAEGVQSQLLGARSTMLRELVDLRERWAPTMLRAWARARRTWDRLGRLLARLLRRGRKMVGVSGAAPASYRAGKMLAEADAYYETLPLVYQRLYSLNPIGDPALLVGRDSVLSEIERRVVAWRNEDGIPLVLYARPGAGISSLLLVLMDRVKNLGHRAVHHTLECRYRNEAEFAAHLAGLMGIPPVDSLDALTAAILEAPEGVVPDLVALEELEHLYMRAPGGTDIVERFLTLMSETEPRVFWLASTTQSAWQAIQKGEPNAVSQVEHMELRPLDAEEVRLAILARHRRSGVPLGYEEPSEGRHLLRRRLRRTKGEEGRRVVLERDFFAKLHQASQGNIGLAIYHWLRAADFNSVPGELRVRPVESVDFSFLDGLDLTQNFTLKAILEHRTLTLEEHDAVFRLPRKESFQIMESLLNRYLVEPVRDADGSEGPAGAEQDVRRYRIVPLLAAAVASHLMARNILH